MDTLQFAESKPDVLKLGIVYPLPEKTIVDFMASHEEVKILEELDNFIELEIKSLAFDHRLKTKILGKKDAEDWIGEYVPEKVYQVMQKHGMTCFLRRTFLPKAFCLRRGLLSFAPDADTDPPFTR